MAERVFYQGKWWSWDGNQMLPEGDTAPVKLSEASQGATGFKMDPNMDPKDRAMVESEMAKRKIPQVSTTDRREAPGIAGDISTGGAQEQLAGTMDVIGKAGPAMLSAIPPAAGAGVAGMLARASMSKPGFVTNIIGRIMQGLGAAGGEHVAQKAGLSEGGLLDTAVSGGLGMLPGAGIGRQSMMPDKASRLVSGGRVARQSSKKFAEADAKKALVEAGADVDTTKIMGPLDDLLTYMESSNMTTGQFRNTYRELNNIRDLIGERYHINTSIKYPKPGTPPKPGGPKKFETDPIYDATDVSPEPKLAKLNTPNRKQIGAGSEQPQPGKPGESGFVKFGVVKEPIKAAPGSVMDDLSRLRLVGEGIEKVSPSLSARIREANRAMTDVVPHLKDYKAAYASGKGFQESAATVRGGSNPAAQIQNMLETRKGGRFSDDQKAWLVNEAQKASGIPFEQRAMLKSQIGQALLSAGLKPAIVRDILGLGAQTGGKYLTKGE